MKIIYFSMTGNIDKFCQKVAPECHRGTKDMRVDEKIILITYTIKFGEVPEDVAIFVKNNKKNIVGVIGSGNKNWGIKYCKAAYIIAQECGVEVLQVFELAGNSHDVAKFNELIRRWDEH